MSGRHWTPETDKEAATLFATLPLAELRRRQSLCDAQTAIAFEARNDRALVDLQSMRDALDRAVMDRLP